MTPAPTDILRAHAEQEFAAELAALAASDDRERPTGWRLSPWAVVTYLLGGDAGDGTPISAEVPRPATAHRDRGRDARDRPRAAAARRPRDGEDLGLRAPGGGRQRRLDALVQGTSGTAEEAIRYGWDYARLLAHGPSREALVASPVMRAMEDGRLVRVEELTRIPSDVQDALITRPVGEDAADPGARRGGPGAAQGFNVIATANDRDKGVNELSSALKRRFNTVVLPLPDDADEEVEIVRRRVAALGRRSSSCPAELEALDEIRRVVTVFRELRVGGRPRTAASQLKSPSGALSTAEAI